MGPALCEGLKKDVGTLESARAGQPDPLAPYLTEELKLGGEVTSREDRLWPDGHEDGPCPAWGSPINEPSNGRAEIP